jgi:serine/threonine protein kinase
VYLLRQVCAALREAHAAGLIHRDIKPPNVIAARRGGLDDVAKLLDFGLVRPTATARATHQSALGQVVGTPLFMSPEQATAGRELNERSDIYSLGALAYYLLTGPPPFEGENGIAVLIAHARDAMVPPSRVRPGIPNDLERVVLLCLAKDAAERYPMPPAWSEPSARAPAPRTGTRIRQPGGGETTAGPRRTARRLADQTTEATRDRARPGRAGEVTALERIESGQVLPVAYGRGDRRSMAVAASLTAF